MAGGPPPAFAAIAPARPRGLPHQSLRPLEWACTRTATRRNFRPVVSLSLGDTALFRVGGLQRNAPTRSFRLASGDAIRLRARVVSPSTASTESHRLLHPLPQGRGSI